MREDKVNDLVSGKGEEILTESWKLWVENLFKIKRVSLDASFDLTFLHSAIFFSKKLIFLFLLMNIHVI